VFFTCDQTRMMRSHLELSANRCAWSGHGKETDMGG